MADLVDIYPGTDARYAIEADGRMTVTLRLRAGTDPRTVVLQIEQAASLVVAPDGALQARLGASRVDPVLPFLPPLASQQAQGGRVSRAARFDVQSANRFGFGVDDRDPALPLEIEMTIGQPGPLPFGRSFHAVDAAGNTFVASPVADAAEKDDPFPEDRWTGCGASIATPNPCLDIAVHKFTARGDLAFVTYLSGGTRETANFAGLAADGTLIVTGTTDSRDFPVTAGVLQPAYAGPAPLMGSSDTVSFGGDLFAVKLDPATGALRAATFFGGPRAERAGQTALARDGTVYFLPAFLVSTVAEMPVTAGALQRECGADPCANGYAAHIDASLGRLLYGTYLPGRVLEASLQPDGTLYFAGAAGAGFPVTANAVQREPAGGEDGIIGRLDIRGDRLLFATYIGGPDSDAIYQLAAGPDATVWAAVSSWVQCCIDVRTRLVQVDSDGHRILAEASIAAVDLAVDRDANLYALASGNVTVSPEALQQNACAWSYLAYIKLSPRGQQLFATYLPAASESSFDGAGEWDVPLLRVGDGRFAIDEAPWTGVHTGCAVDAASFGNPGTYSPGQIVTLFGSGMGPREGVAFQLAGGRVPVSLAGTRVLVDGQPVPVLFTSYWQVNAILPYSLQPGARPRIQVEFNGVSGNPIAGLSIVQRQGISLFRAGGAHAAALNEDGTVNSPQNPARRGARVVLFGTGGGATTPQSVAGEVTPGELRLLEAAPRVITAGRAQELTVEYAGAAPGLVAGVTQLNVKLPDTVLDYPGFARGLVPIDVETPGISFYSAPVTVAVSVD